MDKIKELRERRASLEKAGEAIRASLKELTDEDSFVELSAFCFSEGETFRGETAGEGVVTGFATIGGFPFYIAAQNFSADFGGLTKANCDKIERTLCAAERNETPVVYLLRSQGAKIGEGVEVLEGISGLLLKAARLKGVVPQYAVILGEVYGSAAALASLCDCVFFLKESAMAITSPLVLSAKAGKSLKREEVGGYCALAHAGLPAIEAGSMKEVSARIAEITELLCVPVLDAELNEPAPALNGGTDAEGILSLLEGRVELGGNAHPEIRTVLARLGGISVAAAVFDDVRLTAENLRKLRDFAELANSYSLPLVLFVDCVGVEQTLSVNDSLVLKEIAEYVNLLDALQSPAVSVVTGRAAGLGYSLFAAKSAGYDYTCALATAKISLFESEAGARIVYANEAGQTKEELLRRYDEEFADPVYTAKRGYLDDIVEPQFLKQYLIASLQMLLR